MQGDDSDLELRRAIALSDRQDLASSNNSWGLEYEPRPLTPDSIISNHEEGNGRQQHQQLDSRETIEMQPLSPCAVTANNAYTATLERAPLPIIDAGDHVFGSLPLAYRERRADTLLAPQDRHAAAQEFSNFAEGVRALYPRARLLDLDVERRLQRFGCF